MNTKYSNILGNFTLLTSIVFLGMFYFFAHIFDGEGIPKGTNNIVFVLDVSDSMNAADTPDGSRLRAAKQKIYDIISHYPSYHYSLVIFAGESQRVIPFTQDLNFFATVLHGIDDTNVVLQGTNITDGFHDALGFFGEERSGAIIVLSDGGEDQTEIGPELKKEIENKNLQIHIIGVGSEKGGYIPTGDSFSPVRLYGGKPVVVKLEEENLKHLSREFGAKYSQVKDDIKIEHESKADYTLLRYIFLYISVFFWCVYLYLIYVGKYAKRKY